MHIVTSRMRITHASSVMFLPCLAFLLSKGGWSGGWALSRHEHFLAQYPQPPAPTPLWALALFG